MKWIVRILFFAVSFVLGLWFCSWDIFQIKPDSVGIWWEGLLHGWLFPFNFVRSFFTDCLCKAPDGTTTYTILFWITVVPSIVNLFVQPFRIKVGD